MVSLLLYRQWWTCWWLAEFSTLRSIGPSTISLFFMFDITFEIAAIEMAYLIYPSMMSPSSHDPHSSGRFLYSKIPALAVSTASYQGALRRLVLGSHWCALPLALAQYFIGIRSGPSKACWSWNLTPSSRSNFNLGTFLHTLRSSSDLIVQLRSLISS